MKKYELMALPYAPEALEPVISKETIGFHHGKHLQAYVDNLNKLLTGSEYEGMTLEEIVRKAPAGPVFNNAGQILNHELYFLQFKPVGEAAQGPRNQINLIRRLPLRRKINRNVGQMMVQGYRFKVNGCHTSRKEDLFRY